MPVRGDVLKSSGSVRKWVKKVKNKPKGGMDKREIIKVYREGDSLTKRRVNGALERDRGSVSLLIRRPDKKSS